MAKNQFSTGTSSYESVLKTATTEKTSFLSFSKVYPAYITLLITLAVSIGLWRLVDTQLENENLTSFDKAISSVMNRFEGEYQKNDQVLTSVVGLYDELVQVVKDYFNLYASIPTKTLESLIAVIYSTRVSDKDLDLYYYNIRSQGLWEYVIIPEGIRDFYYPVQFIVPELPKERNMHLSGFDYGTVPLIKKSILNAIETNNTIATPIFNFRKDTAGFFLISPLFKKGAPTETKEDRKKYYQGSVMLEINSNLFFEKSLGAGNQSDSSIVFQCFNVESDGKKDVVFQSRNADLLKTDYEPDLTEDRILMIADKIFTIRFSTIPEFGGSFQKFGPILILIVSLLLSFLAFAFILSVINRKQSALGLAERMTRSQRRIVESSNDIIAVMDLEGSWKSMNPASTKILQYQPDELINQKIDKLFAKKYEQEKFYHILNEPTENLTQKIDVRMLNKAGEEKWISWSLSVSRIEGMVYTTGRDVTLEKIAEDQDKIRNKQVMLAEQLSREASEFKSNFITKLSLQLRNSLTGTLGYLDLITFKAYETDEEHDSYIDEATKSSKEILNFVTTSSDSWGISDAESSDKESLKIMTAVNLGKPFNEAINLFNSDYNKDGKFNIQLDNSIENNIAVVDAKHLAHTLNDALQVMTEEIDSGDIKVSAKELENKDLTQIAITVPTNKLITKMVKIFNENQDNIIDSLKSDKRDIVLRLALSASKFRMINGTLKINAQGDKGNEILVDLHNKVQQEEQA
ncbi:CHASE domain-containing protein [Bacteroidota bacterium]